MTHSPDTGHHAPVRGNPIGVPTLWRAALVAFLFLCASVHAQWQSLNPGAGGQIQDIVLDPNTPGRLFYMSDVEGSYRSDDYGASWDLITQDAASSDHLTIAIEPGHADRVYLGRGDGISISDNGGLNWINVDGVEDPIMQIEINPDAPEECYAVVSQRWRWDQFPTRRTGTRNLYLSRDRGVSWKAVTYEPQNGLRDTYSISLHPVHREVLYLSGQAGLYRSGDRGESWTKVTPPTGSSSGVSWGAALSPDGRTLYATYVTPEKGAVLFARSETAPTDEAAAWINLFALGGSPEPPVGTYWIPRIDPGSTATEHRLLTAAFDNAPTGLIEFTVNVLDGQPVGRSWRPIMTWGGGAYGGNHRNPYTDDVGWELYWT